MSSKKNRLTLPDVLAAVRDLRILLCGMRCLNVYDVDGERTFLLKFAEPGREKQSLLIESGVRLHTTKYARSTPSALPGGFAMKLRKHIRGRRLTSITQAGGDRLVDMQFGSGEASHHILVELFDRGNIVLTDSDYLILSLLRNYTLDAATSSNSSSSSSAIVAQVSSGGSAPSEHPLLPIIEDEVVEENPVPILTRPQHHQRKSIVISPPSLPPQSILQSTNASSSSSSSSAAAANSVRVAVKQRYTFAASKGNVALVSATAATRGDEPSSDPSLEVKPTRNETPSSLRTTLKSSTSQQMSQQQEQHHLPAIDISPSTSPQSLAAAITSFLEMYESTKLAGLAHKVKKKLTVTSILVSRGSGLDVFGPLLVEHACADSGLGGHARLDSLRSSSSSSSSSSSPSLPTTASSFDETKIFNLALSVRKLPSILSQIESEPGPAYAIVDKTSSSAQFYLQAAAAAMFSSQPSARFGSQSYLDSIKGGIGGGGGCIGHWSQVQEGARKLISESSIPGNGENGAISASLPGTVLPPPPPSSSSSFERHP